MHAETLQELSPFEFKDKLIEIATSHKDRILLNAGRGNPNFLATQPRYAFLCLGDFALKESERSYHYLNAGSGFGGLPEKEGIVNRFDCYAALHAENSSISFLQAALSFALDHLGIEKEDLLYEFTHAFLGCNYPVPPRMLPLIEKVVKAYLAAELCGTTTKNEEFDLFATEGGTAAMTYLFHTLHVNEILNPGDTVAIVTPIFSPYLEIPRIPTYNLKITEIKSNEQQGWQVPDEELEKLLDPNIKLLFMVNPSNPSSVKMNREFLDKLEHIVNNSRPELMIVTDDVYATFSDHFRSVFSRCPYNTLCVYSFSKYFGATGWRLGTIMLHERNVFDDLTKKLEAHSQHRLDRRYASLTNQPKQLKFIDRLVADSRAVALNHTAGLSLPQQLQMALFALANLMDENQNFKAEAKRLIGRRYQILYEAIGLPTQYNENSVNYYSLIDLEVLSRNLYSTDFSQWLVQRMSLPEFIMRLADETGVVLLPGSGFDVETPCARVSLANLSEYDYQTIGLAIRRVMDEYYTQFQNTRG